MSPAPHSRRLCVLVDEVDEGTDVGVDTGVALLGAADAPRDDANEGAGLVNDGAARVALARVLAALRLGSADHGVGDGVLGVLLLAGLAADDGHLDLLQGRGAGTGTGLEVAPAGGGGQGTLGRIEASLGQGGEADGAVGGLDGCRQLPDGDVEAGRGALVLGVDGDLGDANLLAAASPVLFTLDC